MAKYYPTGVDNRGDEEHPFGFVYLAKTMSGKPVGRIGFGANRDFPLPRAVWPCRETPDDISRDTLQHVQTLLASRFPDAKPFSRPAPAGIA